ncbi:MULTISPECIES: hypothetical protein [unclassified Polaribacter]|uniref:hypothetical protein n=1 Tax=unclassified Polaribacter TaxID=196858 RepID=UPI0011BEABC8|nr:MULTISPECIES: hypothetical protein [unclassified Polaribacter]TXD52136.1 hypothetical protein ES043_09245 [Polaribacter sp. IC063]TXD59990.1 hypothetical protein ES044_08735 [Polaribacter sp. IC066]
MDTDNSKAISKKREDFSKLTNQKIIIFAAIYYNITLAPKIVVITQNQNYKKELLNMPKIHLKVLFFFQEVKEWYL